jgi:membrane-bound lytic murein transglycosylase B
VAVKANGRHDHRSWIAVGLLLAACGPPVRPADGRMAQDASLQAARARGWAHLVDRLVADGVDRRQVARVFSDPRMPPFDGMEFRVPKPSRGGGGHGGGVNSAEVAGARRCRAQYASAFEETEARTGVPGNVIAALLQVETGCGRNTGTHRVLPALARLAMANEPNNLSLNLSIRSEGADGAEEANDIEHRVKSRAHYLEKTFYPEVRATFEVARRMGVDPLDLRGSFAGAFGIPQFLPSSYLRWGRDGNGDGRVDLREPEDAIASCGNYLASNGWRPGIDAEGRRKVIWHYNHSQAYVNKVLGIANRVGPVGGDSRRDVERRLQVTRARPSPRADLDARAPAIPPPPFEVRPWALAPRPPITWYGRR